MYTILLNKENGYFNLLVESPNALRNDYDTNVHPNNLPIRIVNNDFGKVVVGVSSYGIITQVVLANTNLLSKKKHIDFNYISGVYYPRILELINKCDWFNKKPEFQVVIIAEGKSYLLYDDGYVKEDDFLTNVQTIATSYLALKEISKKNGLDLLIDCVRYDWKISNNDYTPMAFVNTKDFKIEFIKGAMR